MSDAPVSPRNESLAAAVKSCLLSVLGSAMNSDLIADDTNLFDLGIDSMNMTELLLRLEQHFAFTLAPEDLSSSLFLRFDNLVSLVESHVTRG
jgi:acyl carrier protein